MIEDYNDDSFYWLYCELEVILVYMRFFVINRLNKMFFVFYEWRKIEKFYRLWGLLELIF